MVLVAVVRPVVTLIGEESNTAIDSSQPQVREQDSRRALGLIKLMRRKPDQH
jgi:hypothetical protein